MTLSFSASFSSGGGRFAVNRDGEVVEACDSSGSLAGSGERDEEQETYGDWKANSMAGYALVSRAGSETMIEFASRFESWNAYEPLEYIYDTHR
ncbi:hypothetical protein RIF29_15436 [Crotalaria pallida]|uniref:Uncharacterized protein n=1 Tax=Crotalaria pallida TaxID=3830 RepID=A0AAN9FH79_CROPI